MYDQLRFPPGFLWGAATSAYQIEGAAAEDGRGPSIWDTFCRQPGRIWQGQTGDVAADHYHRWAEDVDLMARLGLRAYRFSVSWPRVQPSGEGAVNEPGLAFYDRLVDALLERGIQPFVTLYHFDLPQALQDRGGWPARDTALRFSEYAALMARRLGDRVTWWITHNEPGIVAAMGYYTGQHAPGVRSPLAFARAVHHLLLSHGLAAQAIRAEARLKPRVGIALNLSPVYPASPADKAAAVRYDLAHNRLFLDPLLRGSYPEGLLGSLVPVLARAQPGDLAAISAPLDFLGVNYYSRAIVRRSWRLPLAWAREVAPPPRRGDVRDVGDLPRGAGRPAAAPVARLPPRRDDRHRERRAGVGPGRRRRLRARSPPHRLPASPPGGGPVRHG